MSDARASSHRRRVQNTLLPSAEQVQSLQSRLNCSPGLQRKPRSESGACSVSSLLSVHRLMEHVANCPFSVQRQTLQSRSNTLPGTHFIDSCSDTSLLLRAVNALAWWLLFKALQSILVQEKSCPLLSQRHLLQSMRNSVPGVQVFASSVDTDRSFLVKVAFGTRTAVLTDFWSGSSLSCNSLATNISGVAPILSLRQNSKVQSPRPFSRQMQVLQSLWNSVFGLQRIGSANTSLSQLLCLRHSATPPSEQRQ